MSAVEVPDITPPRREPQDHLPPAAQREVAPVESDGVPTIDLEWEGVTLTIPASVDDWDFDVIEIAETNANVATLKALVGVKEVARLRREFAESHGRPMRQRDIAALIEAIGKASGIEGAGE